MAETPLLYSSIVPLSSQSHRDLRKRSRANYSFAAAANALPLSTAEFVRSVRDYPIVFAGEGDDVHSVAVVGLASHENLMVDKSGHWQADCYVPGYVRRYPFILARQPDSEDLAVCIDGKSEEFTAEGEGSPLFEEDGSHSDYLKRVLDFVREYQQDLERARQFARAIDELGLLEDVNADVSLKVGGKYRLAGLRIVNRRRLAELDAPTCQKLVKNGYLEHVYLHLASMQNFHKLVDALAVRHPEPAPQPEPATQAVN